MQPFLGTVAKIRHCSTMISPTFPCEFEQGNKKSDTRDFEKCAERGR